MENLHYVPDSPQVDKGGNLWKRLLLTFLALATATVANAQFQLPNGGFEQWDGGTTSEPAHWNSFATSDGSYASLASSTHHYRRNGGRPGTQGSHYLTIYTKSIMGVKANGNMTTGRIHAGSTSASSSENYNYTQRGNADHCQPFSGTPDSMYVWVSFYAASSSSEAQISAILHGNNDFRSPNDEGSASLYRAKATARFTRTTSSGSTMRWQQIRVPFVYSGNSQAAYLLVNMTTNATAGGGAANDSLSVDDIVFVYSSWLTGIRVAGVPVEGFSKGRMNYAVHVEDTAVLASCEVTATAEVDDATVTIEQRRVDDTTAQAVITVLAEDGVSSHTYRVTLTSGIPTEPDGIGAAAEPRRLTVSPNPTSGILHVEADGEVCLYDPTGRLVERRTVHGGTAFDLTTMPAGIYLLRNGDLTRRVIKR